MNIQMQEKPALSSPSEVITVLNGTKIKTNNREQGKSQHETPRSKNNKATQNKYTRTIALERQNFTLGPDVIFNIKPH